MIDKSNNAVYVTGSCETTSGNITTERWYIHKVSLLTGQDLVTPPVQITGSATGSDGADDLVGSSIPFVPYELLQRPALLKVAVSGAQPSSLIYVAFGWGSAEEKGDAYHGWIFGYDSSLTQQFAFVTSAKGTSGNTDFPACNASCTACRHRRKATLLVARLLRAVWYLVTRARQTGAVMAEAYGCPAAVAPQTRLAVSRMPISQSATVHSSRTPCHRAAPC